MDVKLIVSLLIKNKVFNFKSYHDNKNFEFRDLFYNRTVKIASNILINKYLQIIQGNEKVTQAQSVNLDKKNTEIVATATIEREAHILEKSNNDF